MSTKQFGPSCLHILLVESRNSHTSFVHAVISSDKKTK